MTEKRRTTPARASGPAKSRQAGKDRARSSAARTPAAARPPPATRGASTLEHALAAAAAGWFVFRCKPRLKSPLHKRWQAEATRDPQRLRELWRAQPDANVGLRTGLPSGWWVLDVDPAKGGAASLEELERRHGRLPATLVFATGGGGHHIVFRLPSKGVHNRKDVRPGLDVRGEGGLIVGPGSVHPSGGRYSVARDVAPVEAPAWLLALVCAESEPAPPPAAALPASSPPPSREAQSAADEERRQGTIERARRELAGARFGTRNEELNRWVYSLAGLGMTEREIESELWPTVQAWVGEPASDPFTVEEWRKTLRSASSAGARRQFAPATPRPPRMARDPRRIVQGRAAVAEARGRGGVRWVDRLVRTPKGTLRSTLPNVTTIFDFDPRIRDVLVFNEFRGQTWLRARPCWMPENDGQVYPRQLQELDVTLCVRWLQDEYEGREWSCASVDRALRASAEAHRRWHPVREYLSGLKWDGTPRLETWAIEHLGAPDTDYVRAVSVCWMISAVARIFRPGCQVDHVLVLEGAQGIGKSSALRVLAGDWYKDDKLRLNDPTELGVELRGVWIYEIAELSGLRRSQVEDVKGALTKTSDRFRPKYGREWIEQPRECVFAASTNERRYLMDLTGNRRFWPVLVGATWEPGRRVALGRLAQVREQLWAESSHRYNGGEPWHLRGALADLAAVETEKRLDTHPWEDLLREWAAQREYTSTEEALRELGVEPARQTHTHKTDVGFVLHRLGFTHEARGWVPLAEQEERRARGEPARPRTLWRPEAMERARARGEV